VRAASEIVPVTQVPTGNVKLHQVGPNGIPPRSARAVSAAAMASHSIANPHVGSPYSRANTSAPAGYGARSSSPATRARFPAAVIDCPSGPSMIQQVGTMMAGSVLWVTSRDHTSGMMMTDANKLMPNIA
jgi:hypothetical protein